MDIKLENVKKIVLDWDPIDILMMDVPESRYDNLVNVITENLNNSLPIEEINHNIIKTLEKDFNLSISGMPNIERDKFLNEVDEILGKLK